MKVLHLTLKKKWFDMIASGEKQEEYREIKSYWSSRLLESYKDRDGFIFDGKDQLNWFTHTDTPKLKEFDIIRFKNGYAKDAPSMDIDCLGIKVKEGRKDWGAEPGVKYFVICLGKKIA